MQIRRLARHLALLASLAALPACGDCRASLLPQSDVPPGLSIPVEVDGKETAPLDAARFQGTPPDFREGERRSWRLRSLLGDVCDRPGLAVDVEDGEGKRAVISAAGDAEGRMPTIALNRNGEVRIGLVKPNEPFPPFHGRGGNRGRGGEPERIREVRRIRLVSSGEIAAKPAVESAAPIELQVVIDGAPKVTWRRADLAKVPPTMVPADDGEGSREIWPLRAVADALVGPGALLTSVSGEDGRAVDIAPADYRDPGKVPALRMNRRGVLKFVWLTPALEPAGGDDVRGVTGLGFRRAP